MARFGGVDFVNLPHPKRQVGCALEASFHPGRTERNHLRVLAPTAGADDARVDDLLEPALTVLFFVPDWQVPLNLMPSGATNAMLGVNSPVLFASDQPYLWWQGALVLAGWCLLPALVGVLVTVRRDVN